MYKKKSKAKFLHNQIIAFIEKNPKASSKYIADKLGASSQYVYQLRKRHNLDKALEMSKPSAVFLTKSSTKEEAVDKVNHPPHYKVGGIETIDFIEAKKLNYNLGNVIKYITRADYKGSRNEDLKKALWYLNRELGRKA